MTENNPTLNDVAHLHAQEYRLSAMDFWYWARFIMTDDEDSGQVRPFPLDYPYLHRVNKEINENQKVIILKSRRLMISWLGMMRMLYQAMFAGTGMPDTKDAFRGGIMTLGEIEATYLIERATKVYHRFPEWMKNRNPLITDNKLLMRFKEGGTIQAFAMKREGPQTFGFSEVFFDEMALQDAARTTWTGMIPTLGALGKVIAVSTPNGKFNFFYDIWSNKNDNFDDIHRVTIHWAENPEHDRAWYDKTTSGLDDQGIARMFELSFSHYAGQKVWTTFDRLTHVAKATKVIPSRPVLIGWDFGFHFPACIFAQYNTRDQYVIHSEFVEYDISFGDFVDAVLEHANTFMDIKKMPPIHFVDPAGSQAYHSRAVSGAVSDIHELKLKFGQQTQIRMGAMEIGTRDNEGPRLKEVRPLWKLRKDGNPGIVVNEKCSMFIDGASGGYCYPEKGGEVPSKNEYSHIQDAFQYLVTAYNRMNYIKVDRVGSKKKRPRIGRRTGL